MKIKELKLINFRNYTSLDLSFSKNIVCFTGLNGQGKTNIVEAVSVLGLLNSFRTNNYSEMVKFGESNFFIKGIFKNTKDREIDIRISYDGLKKRIMFQNKKVNKFSELWGKLPIVYLIPDESVITTGPPNNRRDFIDKLLSMIDPVYFSDLKNYNKVLKQKNSILFNRLASEKGSFDMIPVYNSQLVESGYEIYNKRKKFISDFKRYFSEILFFISDEQYKGVIKYKTKLSEDDYKSSFKADLKNKMPDEIKRGTSLTGPHKDDMELLINDRELRKYGSKGQHKLYLVALKLAEIEYIKSITDEYPVFILDDLYSEIDEKKSFKIADILDNEIQTFITTSNNRLIEQLEIKNTELYIVDNAVCKRIS